jgi:phosphoribosylaminoimidazolecarboxamide formyltransferase/IMP cyclohydrolase
MTESVTLRRALLSVSDKTGLADLGAALAARGVTLLSTGGTAAALREAGLDVTDVSEVTGFPEMMDGRVKTLHPVVHGGLLALREDPDHAAAMQANGIDAIDLLVVNLYPFEATVARGADPAEIVETIDIGGPAMIRAGAKNHRYTSVIVDPEDYDALLQELQANDGATTLPFRQRQAAIAYGRTAAYDAAIATWMARHEETPRRVAAAATLAQPLRYGENPHQAAAFYRDGSDRPGVATATQHQGKALSYNNIADTDAAMELVAEFDRPAIAIIKHANPCGVAVADDLATAYMRAFDCDRISAFGGIVACNRPLDEATAQAIAGIFTEVVIAPDATEAARAVFAAKPNLRLLTTGAMPDPRAPRRAMKQVAGGWLVQDRDVGHVAPEEMRVVTKAAPDADQMRDLTFAWAVAKHVASNAIVYAKSGATVGVGAGQMNRLDSSRIAARKAEEMGEITGLGRSAAIGSVVASDAFFPFPDGLLAAAEAGATTVIQPGGSMRDDAVIEAADEAGLAMVFTGQRHFRH